MSDLLKAIAHSSLVHNEQIRPVPNPVVGAELVIPVPSPEDWRLIAVRATLTTSAVVANRVPELGVDDQTTTGASVTAMTTQPASTAVVYDFTAMSSAFSTGALATGAHANVGIVDWVVPMAWRIRTVTVGLDVGDQWSAATVMFERIDEPPWRAPLVGTEFDDEVEHEISMRALGG